MPTARPRSVPTARTVRIGSRRTNETALTTARYSSRCRSDGRGRGDAVPAGSCWSANDVASRAERAGQPVPKLGLRIGLHCKRRALDAHRKRPPGEHPHVILLCRDDHLCACPSRRVCYPGHILSRIRMMIGERARAGNRATEAPQVFEEPFRSSNASDDKDGLTIDIRQANRSTGAEERTIEVRHADVIVSGKDGISRNERVEWLPQAAPWQRD